MMARRVSLPEHGISGEDAGLTNVVDSRTKSGSLSSEDDGDTSIPKQGKFFKSLTRSLDPATAPPRKKDYLEEYQKYKAKRAFNLHGVVKQQTIDLGTLGLSSSSTENAQSRRFSTGAHPPQSKLATEQPKSTTLPGTSHVNRGPPPPVAPRKKSVNFPVIKEPMNKVNVGHETPSYILSAAKKEQQKAEIESKKSPIASPTEEAKELPKQDNHVLEEKRAPTEHGLQSSGGEMTGEHIIESSIKEEQEPSQVEEGGASSNEENVNEICEPQPQANEPKTEVTENQGVALEADVNIKGEDESKKDEEENIHVVNDANVKEIPAVIERKNPESEVGKKDTEVSSDEKESSVEIVESTVEAEKCGKLGENTEEGEKQKDEKEQIAEILETVANGEQTEKKEDVKICENVGKGGSEELVNDVKDEKQHEVDIQNEIKIEEKATDVQLEQTDGGGANDVPHVSAEENGEAKNGVSDGEAVKADEIKTEPTNEGATEEDDKVITKNGNVENLTEVTNAPSTENTPTSDGHKASTEKLSKTADLLLSFSQDQIGNVGNDSSDLTGIGEELKKLNLSIEELSHDKTKSEIVSQEDAEKLQDLETMRNEMDMMKKDLDLFG